MVEVLVTIGVLTMVLAIFAQIFGQASSISVRETKRSSSFSGVVLALDRLSIDLARRVRGENMLTVSPDGKALSFYTQVRNSAAGSRLSLISYHLENGKLFRNVQAVNWGDEFSGPPVVTGEGEVLAAEVFGLQLSFLRQDGRIYPQPHEKAENNVALIVTMASLDLHSRRRSPEADPTLAALNATHLPGVDPAGSTETPLHLWDAVLLSQQADELESAIRQDAFFHERYYSLD